MHPTTGYSLAKAHVADLRHQAQRAALARAARPTQPHTPRRRNTSSTRKRIRTIFTNRTIHQARGLKPGRRAKTTILLAAAGVLATGATLAAPGPAWAGTSGQYGGYTESLTYGLASAGATFTVPKLTCSSADNNTWESIGVFGDGGSDDFSGVTLQCSGTTPKYSLTVSEFGAGTSKTGVKPGDVVVTSIFQTATTGVTWIHDLTNGQSAYSPNTFGGLLDGPDSFAVIGLLHACNGYRGNCPVIPFATTAFTNVQVNGTYLTFDTPTSYNLEPTVTSGEAIASKLGAPGDNFTLTYS
jgi:hypothetical protein